MYCAVGQRNPYPSSALVQISLGDTMCDLLCSDIAQPAQGEVSEKVGKCYDKEHESPKIRFARCFGPLKLEDVKNSGEYDCLSGVYSSADNAAEYCNTKHWVEWFLFGEHDGDASKE